MVIMRTYAEHEDIISRERLLFINTFSYTYITLQLAGKDMEISI
jgi:hypothetical protein